jgi:hypothetical protein
MTSTDFLVQVMEHFAKSEPKTLLLVWVDEGGDVNMTNHGSVMDVVGLAEYAKATALRRIFEQPTDEGSEP